MTTIRKGRDQWESDRQAQQDIISRHTALAIQAREKGETSTEESHWILVEEAERALDFMTIQATALEKEI